MENIKEKRDGMYDGITDKLMAINTWIEESANDNPNWGHIADANFIDGKLNEILAFINQSASA